MPTKYGMCGTIGGRYDISSSVRIFGADGSVHVQHGGCEIGQGIHTKVAQAVALGLRCPLELVRVGETSTSVSPNSSSTGGSGTSESAVRSVLIACRKLRTALAPYDVADDWVATVAKAFAAGAELAAHGWSTPPSEEPFDYATYGVAAVEVQIDALTGELQIERADLMMDQGTPLNPAVDLGQAEGGFVMALGLFFTEEVQWSAAGAQLNLGTWEYKVPGAHDIPLEFNIRVRARTAQPVEIRDATLEGVRRAADGPGRRGIPRCARGDTCVPRVGARRRRCRHADRRAADRRARAAGMRSERGRLRTRVSAGAPARINEYDVTSVL